MPEGLDGTQEAVRQEERWGRMGEMGTKSPFPMTPQ